MDKVQKPNNSGSCTLLSEPFRFLCNLFGFAFITLLSCGREELWTHMIESSVLRFNQDFTSALLSAVCVTMIVQTDALNVLMYHNLAALGLLCPKCRLHLIPAAEDCNIFRLPTWAICVEKTRGMSECGFQHGEQHTDTSSWIQNKSERMCKKFVPFHEDIRTIFNFSTCPVPCTSGL
jgi:hypothetical protein